MPFIEPFYKSKLSNRSSLKRINKLKGKWQDFIYLLYIHVTRPLITVVRNAMLEKLMNTVYIGNTCF